MGIAEQGNETALTEFLLLGFGDLGDERWFLFLLFIVIYIVTMVGNIMILLLVVVDHHLHTPMYFFLGNLSCLDTCYSSNFLPVLLANLSHGGQGIISRKGCMTQYYFFGLLAGTDCYLLAVMSYDSYVAICKPLLYTALMNDKVCLHLAAGSWVSSCLVMNILVYLVHQLHFCGPAEINHFFCDLNPLLKLSCNDTHTLEILTFFLGALFSLPPFLLTLMSYGYIICTILRIPSITGRQKAFSTCSSHLIVVSIFYGTIMIVYLLPKTETLSDLNKVCSLFYTVLPPLFNPLRNREVKLSFKRAVTKFCAFKRL